MFLFQYIDGINFDGFSFLISNLYIGFVNLYETRKIHAQYVYISPLHIFYILCVVYLSSLFSQFITETCLSLIKLEIVLLRQELSLSCQSGPFMKLRIVEWKCKPSKKMEIWADILPFCHGLMG
jgi:hypothetical protein